MFRYLPEQASEIAPRVDFINNLITDISVFFIIAICGAMLYFAIRYRRRDGKDHETPRIEGSDFLEVVWTGVPTIICILVAYYGVTIYQDMRTVGPGATEISVGGHQWYWDFTYDNGKKTTNEVVVPVNKPVQFVMQSTDVLHSFFIPDMRVKKDLIPGEYTYLTFKPVKTGTYQIYCTEYCGTNHSDMLANLKVVSDSEYNQWYADNSEAILKSKMKPSDLGEKVYVEKGCKSCHSLDGSRLVGSSWLKIYGREGKLSDGTTYKADENYIKRSILEPNAQIVESYPPNMMPSFQGQLTDEDINNIIAFMKTLNEAPAAPKPAEGGKPTAAMTPAERGKALYQSKACVGCHSLDGSKLVGPSWKGFYGKQGKLADGSSYTADDAYIKKSILEPASQIVEGYQNMMPPMGAQISDDDIKDIIEFMKTLK